jgi:hypothetical protein
MRHALLVFLLGTAAVCGQGTQWVEGFSQVEARPNGSHPISSRDFRGSSRGFMTTPWWTHGTVQTNRVSWRTAVVPAKQATTFLPVKPLPDPIPLKIEFPTSNRVKPIGVGLDLGPRPRRSFGFPSAPQARTKVRPYIQVHRYG